jgi:hypothetical protein
MATKRLKRPSLADIMDAREMAWNRFATDHGLIRSLCAVAWAPQVAREFFPLEAVSSPWPVDRRAKRIPLWRSGRLVPVANRRGSTFRLRNRTNPLRHSPTLVRLRRPIRRASAKDSPLRSCWGNNVDCPRSTASTKRFIATSPRKSRHNLIMRGVFTQPGPMGETVNAYHTDG